MPFASSPLRGLRVLLFPALVLCSLPSSSGALRALCGEPSSSAAADAASTHGKIGEIGSRQADVGSGCRSDRIKCNQGELR